MRVLSVEAANKWAQKSTQSELLSVVAVGVVATYASGREESTAADGSAHVGVENRRHDNVVPAAVPAALALVRAKRANKDASSYLRRKSAARTETL
eukprot:2079666-Pleurochrysis_carterae.AAC.1